MQVALFGATGKTGGLVLANLLAKGHKVTVLVRDPAKLPADLLAQVKLVQGDVRDAQAVARTLEGVNAVTSALGMVDLGPSTLMTEAMKTISATMLTAGIKRIISIATVGIFKEIRGIPGLFINYMLRHALKDHRAAYDVLAATNLDWTVIRPLGLVDTPAKGAYQVELLGAPKKSRTISRADVANFLVHVLDQRLYLRQSPAIGDRE